MSSLAARLLLVRETITNECLRLARPEPILIVVTKNNSVNLASELFDLGERDFGENRVQEAAPKFADFSTWDPSRKAKWHLIGQLQSNKVKQALDFASSIHSLDRVSLLQELAKRTAEKNQTIEVFIQVNLTNDENRGGVAVAELLEFADRVAEVPTLILSGLMAVASLEREPEQDFEVVANASQKLIQNHPAAGQLSIGMSNDYLQAIGFGATHLRIGTAITGKWPN